MNKQIQLRGISRTPSDRMSADGGCAESLNVYLKDDELAPMPVLKNVTSELELPMMGSAKAVYIHKTEEYNNYIMQDGRKIGYGFYELPEGALIRQYAQCTDVTAALYVTKAENEPVPVEDMYILFEGAYYKVNSVLLEEGTDNCYFCFHEGALYTGLQAFMTLQENEKLVEIKSIGNTLLVLTDKRLEYVLYKNKKYRDLGDHLPEPKIKFEYSLSGNPIAFKTSIDLNKTDFTESAKIVRSDSYSHASLISGVGEASDAYTFYNNRIKPEWQAAGRSIQKSERAFGRLTSTVALRYAYRMYDGTTYARHSAPVIIDPFGFTKYDLNTYIGLYRSHTFTDGSGKIIISKAFGTDEGVPNVYQSYNLKIKIEEANLGDWCDVIQSVDFFTTGEYDLLNLELNDISDRTPGSDGIYWTKLNMKSTTKEQYLDKITNASFYRFLSISSKEYKAEEISVTDLEDWSPDILATKERLKNDVSGTNDIVTPKGIEVYNKRLLMSGANVKHMDGYYFEPSHVNGSDSYDYRIRYFMNSINGDDIIVSRDYSIGSGGLGPWLFYPNTRCYKAEVYCKDSVVGEGHDNRWHLTTISMTEHPTLNGAYGFNGINRDWSSGTVTNNIPTETQPYESKSNRLLQSVFENPFVIENEESFTAELLGTAVITKPLSTGQFGYANIYVFTSDGLYAMTTESDGSFGNMNPVSQDVALSGTTICQLDQAIVFTTKKGVMLLRGSDLKCISEKMNGKHYVLDNDTKTILQGSGNWGNLAQLIGGASPLTFQKFVEKAKTVYDYVSNRLLFFNTDGTVKYAYVYMLAEDSWHKMSIDNTISFLGTLNSYPESYITMGMYGHPYVYSCSEVDDPDSEERRSGIIVTRPFTCDADDVRKVINHLMVRGMYGQGHVQYILQGSMDGIHWARLGSLRGGSYNMFRLVILTLLSPSERVTHIDIDYETRFDGRMR